MIGIAPVRCHRLLAINPTAIPTAMQTGFKKLANAKMSAQPNVNGSRPSSDHSAAISLLR